jgi:hypothetical protein
MFSGAGPIREGMTVRYDENGYLKIELIFLQAQHPDVVRIKAREADSVEEPMAMLKTRSDLCSSGRSLSIC